MQTRPGRTTKRQAPAGYIAIDKVLAQALYEGGYSITLCGNNVNMYHVFHNWCLGCTIDKQTTEERTALEYTWQDHINSFMFYLEPELGRYIVFYVKVQDLQKYNQAHKKE